MREQRIIPEPFEMLDILRCSGSVCGNCHGYMVIKGHINKDLEEEYLQMLSGDVWVNVKVYDESEKSDVLFSGIVTEGCIEVENGLKSLQLTIKTGTFLMDLKEHTRTFQNKGASYKTVLDTLTSPYPESGYIMVKGGGQTIGRFLCQYQETDWQFAKRLGSYCNTILYPNYIGAGVKYYFGMPHGESQGRISSTEYYLNRTGNGMSYCVRLRELFNIGDTVSFLGRNLRIISRKTEFENGELYHTYELMQQEKGMADFAYNDSLTGVSLSASVTNVEGTNVCVSIMEDENQKASGSRWFPYATVYSSPDGTGWYCMPETGDEVRIYFPSNKEDEAYVFSSVHMTSRDSNERCNPDYKSIMNKQGKEILFKPDSILITNNAGMSLELSDEEGISIISDKKIVLESEKAIEITSINDRVDIVAPKQISLKQGNTNMVLSDNLTMRGAKVRLD